MKTKKQKQIDKALNKNQRNVGTYGNAVNKKLKSMRPEIKKIEDNIIQPQVTAENNLLIEVLTKHLKRTPVPEDFFKCMRFYEKDVTTEYTFVYDKTILGNVKTSITDDGVLMEFRPA